MVVLSAKQWWWVSSQHKIHEFVFLARSAAWTKLLVLVLWHQKLTLLHGSFSLLGKTVDLSILRYLHKFWSSSKDAFSTIPVLYNYPEDLRSSRLWQKIPICPTCKSTSNRTPNTSIYLTIRLTIAVLNRALQVELTWLEGKLVVK